jgi:hypothetical protein
MKNPGSGWLACAVTLLMTSVACSAYDPAQAEEPGTERAAAPASGVAASAAVPSPAPVTVEEWAALQRGLEARVDSVDRLLIRIPNLTARELGELRRDVNAVQTARARVMGIPRGGDVERLESSGRLRRLAASTRYWVVRDLDYSVPYVTPDTEAMLAEIGERWLASLDSLGLPRYRMEITSVLRTPADQARLRRSNANAASGVSSHEFGTTIDIAYRRFAPPLGSAEEIVADLHPAVQPQLRILHDSMMVETAVKRGTELQAVLGRVIGEMRREGKLLVMMERQQTVYHMTVARRLPPRGPVPAE